MHRQHQGFQMNPLLRNFFLAVIALSASIYVWSHQVYSGFAGAREGGLPAFLAPLLFAAIVIPIIFIAKDIAAWRSKTS
jgi:hypothetical protein